MARHLIPSDLTLRAIKPGDPRKRTQRRRRAVPAALRQRRLARLAVQLQLPRQTEAAVDGDVSRKPAWRSPARWPRRRVRPSPRASTPATSARTTKAACSRTDGLPRTRVAQGAAASEFVRSRSPATGSRCAGGSWAPSYSREDHRAAGERCLPVARPDAGHHHHAAACCSRCCGESRARGVVETAHRALENCSQVFRYGIAIGQATTNPGARPEGSALKRPQPKHFAAITEPERLAQLLRACDGYAATHVVRAALKLQPMLLLRPGELRAARVERDRPRQRAMDRACGAHEAAAAAGS